MLWKTTLLVLTFLSLQVAAAGKFDFLPASNGPEKEFRSLMESGNFRQAQMAWGTAYRSSSFAQSNTGVATWAYLLYQNGLTYSALETLIGSTQPSKIDPRLVQLWTTEMKNSTYIQKGWITTTGGWRTIINNDPIAIHIKKKADIASAFVRADRLSKESVNEKARIWWQIATQAPQIGEVDSSLKALKLMRESGQIAIGQDQVAMTQGRVLYQKNDLEAALNSWQQIPKGSSLWVEAVEERAWAYLRASDYDKAMGTVTTAMSPVLAPLAGPETYFLANLMSLRTCDYARIFKNSETFKTRHRARLADIQDLATKGSNNAINQVFERFDQKGVSQESAGAQVEAMPRQLFRDSRFVRMMESRRELLTEIQKGTQLFEDSKTLGSSADLERTLTDARNKAERLKQLAFQRARALAQVDLKEYRMVLNKMHIIEGEVIERLHVDESLKGQRSKLASTDDKGDVLVFPYTAEVWIDELDNYKARVKDCPTLKGASL